MDDEPHTFPSPAAASAKEARGHYITWATFNKGLVEHTHTLFWIMLVQDVLGVSVYFTVQTTLQTAMNDRGFSRYDQNVSGISFQVVGLIGTIGFSYLVDRFQILRVGSFVCWCLSMLMFTLLGERIITTGLGDSIIGLYCISAATGLALSSIPPIALQLACNTVFPIPPALVSASIFMLAQLATIAVLLTTRAIGGDTAWYIMYGVLGVATCFSVSNLFMPLRRTELDNKALAIHNGEDHALLHSAAPKQGHRKRDKRKKHKNYIKLDVASGTYNGPRDFF